MKKVDLVFRTIGERTSDIALELAIRHIQPHQVHRIENIFPFSAAVQTMLQIDYDCDYVVFMDADCLILENMGPFLQCNDLPYVDCYVLDKFRGLIHQGVHITRIDVVRTMQTIPPPENDEKYVLRPESRLRSFALSKLKASKCFKPFRIFHDHFQYYPHIYAKLALRELRSRTPQNRRELNAAERYWAKHPEDADFTIAQAAVAYTRQEIAPDATPAEIDRYIRDLPNLAAREVPKLPLPEQTELTYAEVAAQAKQQWGWQLVTLPGDGQFAEPDPPRDAVAPAKPKAHKLFGIGLSRTGTKSLTTALQTLGLRVVHYPEDETTLRELAAGEYNLSLLQHFDGITDITVAPYYAQLDKLFPGSKFILTVRPEAEWLASMEQHYRHRPAFSDEDSGDFVNHTHMKIRRLLRAAVYGCYEFSRDRMAYVREVHHRNVLDYFKDRPEDLLVMDIVAGDGWDKLCPFLGQSALQSPFPYTKKHSALKAMLDEQAQPIVP
jgi:hypothetical protein